MKKINLINNPFSQFCINLGFAPTSYSEALTYEEQILWLIKFLEQTVIPSIQDCEEAVIELQGLYEELKNYVDHYFDNLDVQEEINNKLDDMVQNGEFMNIVSQYIDTIYENYQNQINNTIDVFETNVNNRIDRFETNVTNEINDFENNVNSELESTQSLVNTSVNTLQSQINSLGSGSPLVASSTSEMTDTSRVYVNTTDGKWYYYNGEEWTIGGTYQSTGLNESSIDVGKLDGNFTNLLFSAKNFNDSGLLHYAPNIRLTQPMLLKKGDTITFSADFLSDYYYRVWKNTNLFSSSSISSLTSYVNTPNSYTVPETGYYTLGFRYGDEETLTVDDSDITNSEITLSYYTKKVLANKYDNSYVDLGELLSSFAYAKWDYSKHFLIYATTDVMMCKAYKFDNPVTIRLKDYDTYEYLIFYTSDSKIIEDNRLPDSGWKHEDITIPKNNFFSIRFRKRAGGDITLSEMYNNLKIVQIDPNIPVIQNDIISINTTLNTLSIPDYWESTIESKISEINSLELSTDFNGDTFIFITDCHWASNAKKSPLLIRNILNNTNISKVIFGGDILNLDSSKATAISNCKNFYKAFENISIFTVLGNHDLNNNQNTYPDAYLTQQEVYSLNYKKVENTVNDLAKPINNTNPVDSSFYYYMDNEEQKIRYICLNNAKETYESNQLAWLKDRLYELDSNWTVILFTHIVCSSLDGTTPVVNQSYTDLINYLTTNNNYSCTIAGLISGHTHYDYNFTSSIGFPVIITNTDCYSLSDTAISQSMSSGTTSEQCFDVITLDKTNRKLYCTRIGAGSDREISY